MARCVLTRVPGGYPLSNVDIELVRTDSMLIVEVVQTNKAGEAQFGTTLPGPCFFRPRIIGKNWNLQVTDTGLGYSLYDRVVALDGLGTDLNFTTAIAALAATGGTIGARTGDYEAGAILTIPTNMRYVIEGIGHGIIEDLGFTPVMGVQIHNPGGAGGFNGVIFHVDTGAMLTLRGVEVHQDRAFDAIEAHTIPSIIIEDSWVHVDNAVGSTVDTSYDLRIHRSILQTAGAKVIDEGPAIVYLEVTESRLTSPTFSIDGPFGELYFEKCQLSKFRCHTTTASGPLRILNCKVRGGTAGAPGIEVGSGGHDDIQIFDNDVDGDTGHAIQIGYTTLDLAERYQVNNNRLHSTGGHGLYIAGYVKGLTACGNMFSGNAAGYCIETANALYPEYAVFGCNTHDGSAAGVYGPTMPAGFAGEHHNLSGLLDDDHTQYLLASGARALTAQWNPGAFIIGNYDFTAKPTALYVGDANFELYIEAGGPVIIFDTGFDFLGYVRASNTFTFAIGGVSYLQLESTGLLVDHILELAAGHGVVVDGCLIKDGRAALALGLRETSGPTDLIVGAIADGEFLKRVGATIVSAAGVGGGDVATDTIWAAAGDLAVGTGNDTAGVLTKGADGKVLTMVGGAVAWAAAGAGGGGDDVLALAYAAAL